MLIIFSAQSSVHPVNETATSNDVICRLLLRPPNKTLCSTTVLLMMANKAAMMRLTERQWPVYIKFFESWPQEMFIQFYAR